MVMMAATAATAAATPTPTAAGAQDATRLELLGFFRSYLTRRNSDDSSGGGNSGRGSRHDTSRATGRFFFRST